MKKKKKKKPEAKGFFFYRDLRKRREWRLEIREKMTTNLFCKERGEKRQIL